MRSAAFLVSACSRRGAAGGFISSARILGLGDVRLVGSFEG